MQRTVSREPREGVYGQQSRDLLHSSQGPALRKAISCTGQRWSRGGKAPSPATCPKSRLASSPPSSPSDVHWTGRIQSAQASALTYHAAAAQGLLWTRRLEHRLQSLAEKPLMPTPIEPAHWHCRLCEAKFDSKTTLTVHPRQVHGYVQVLKYYVLADECLACGKKFFQRSRALAHCNASAACQQVYFSCMVPTTEAHVQALAAEDLEYAQA